MFWSRNKCFPASFPPSDLLVIHLHQDRVTTSLFFTNPSVLDFLCVLRHMWVRCPVECAASPTPNYSHNQDDYHDEHDHDFDEHDVGDNMNDY